MLFPTILMNTQLERYYMTKDKTMILIHSLSVVFELTDKIESSHDMKGLIVCSAIATVTAVGSGSN